VSHSSRQQGYEARALIMLERTADGALRIHDAAGRVYDPADPRELVAILHQVLSDESIPMLKGDRGDWRAHLENATRYYAHQIVPPPLQPLLASLVESFIGKGDEPPKAEYRTRVRQDGPSRPERPVLGVIEGGVADTPKAKAKRTRAKSAHETKASVGRKRKRPRGDTSSPIRRKDADRPSRDRKPKRDKASSPEDFFGVAEKPRKHPKTPRTRRAKRE